MPWTRMPTASGGQPIDHTTEAHRSPRSANGRPAPIPIGMHRRDAGTLIWARNLARGTNTATLSFYLEIHEYPG